ncbi:hypothetical protein MKI84_19255 [Ancylobacter sp. A5.8]|uniref:hypothetical protein n=1 Tax=Ancylobacter gelatini TaxID=2919920 RepID=UPI001F4DF161|nr:hypothetical protein [Ancylobacter gelatini]MCJ8145066.1 hypothetical protein [Ancylobacter gelatini]
MYPLVKAMKECYSDTYEMEEASFETASQKPDLGRSICWHMMGYYPKKLAAACTIHDYRSLSLGRGAWFKDRIKERLNARPDIRIIQPSIADRLHFFDRVDTYLLDVAISTAVLEYHKTDPDVFSYDFCYVGAMKAERKIEVMVDSFLRHVPQDKTLLMVGQPEPYLVERYRDQPNVRFTGPVPQRQVFDYVLDSNVTVSYFPNHAPHIFQTPTKMLEYAAIGGRILANEQAMNRFTAEKYGIKAAWGSSDDLFRSLPATTDWPTNMDTDPLPMTFERHLKESGLVERLQAIVSQIG